mmetsp:Transcript_19721/g.35091  ORF Transcript_19721/g.35091 Transcript_19721/m.35091 type:complete len:213 (+) Transcript_19721:246-884(+)
MIQANKATVVTSFHKQALDVRKLELDYYLMVYDKLSTISSLLAGFASTALMVGIPRKDNPYLVTLFLLSTGSALGSHLLVVIVTTMCTMWGPGHALKGGDSTFVDNAVYILESTKDSMERFFMFGLVCYFASSILVVWLLFDYKGSVVVTTIMTVSLVWLSCKSHAIYRRLQPNRLTSGYLNYNRVRNVGELMGDGSLNADGVIAANFATKI